jgi:hypothetical protein
MLCLHCAGIIMGTVLPYGMAKVSSAGRQCLHISCESTTVYHTVEVFRRLLRCVQVGFDPANAGTTIQVSFSRH